MENFKIISTGYISSDGAVISANILDFGAAGDGKADDTGALNAAIASLAGCGGTVWLPAGTYRLTRPVTVPTAVQLLGDFNPPDETDPRVGGTVLAIETPSLDEGGTEYFFTLSMGSAMRGFSVWYPEQRFINSKPRAYPFTVGLESMVCTTLEYINFVNAYDCVDHFSITNNQQTCRYIFGTPLDTSVRVRNVNDINRYENFDLQPLWWLGSGLPGVPDESELRGYLYENAVGFDLISQDWHYIMFFNIKGYGTGIHLVSSIGRVYGCNISECRTCLAIDRPTWYGTTVTDCCFSASGSPEAVAMRIGKEAIWGVSCNSVTFKTSGRHAVEALGNGQLSMQHCCLISDDGGEYLLYSLNTRFSVSDCEFIGGKKDIYCGKSDSPEDNTVKINWDARELLIDNGVDSVCKAVNCVSDKGAIISDAADERLLLTENSAENRIITHSFEKAKKHCKTVHKEPARRVLYTVSAISGENDISEALQTAIDKAAAEGGGTVYLPRGIYRLENPITVKSGVELRGCTAFPHYVTCDTTYLLTDYGKGSADMRPLIVLEKNSGLCGLAVVYDKVDPDDIQPYATAVQGRGEDIYVINTVISTAWTGIDLETYRCDRHYIEDYNFYCLKTGIAIGGGSRNGIVTDAQSNPCTITENPHRTHEWDGRWGGKLFTYFEKNVTGFSVGDTVNELFYSTFVFGTLHGIHAHGNADLTVITHGSDYSVHGIYLTEHARVAMSDVQISGARGSNSVLTEYGYDGTAVLINSCGWAVRDTALRIKGGTVMLDGGIFFENSVALLYADGGDITLSGLVTLRRALADYMTYPGLKSFCAYGNIAVYTRHYLSTGVKMSGSDLKAACAVQRGE